MNRLSLKNNWLKFTTAGKLLVVYEESLEYIPNLIKDNRRMSACNRLDLQTLGSQPVACLQRHAKMENFYHATHPGVHSIVKLNTTCDKKYIYFLHKASPKWVKILSIFFMSRYTRYLLHSKKTVTKYDDLFFS